MSDEEKDGLGDNALEIGMRLAGAALSEFPGGGIVVELIDIVAPQRIRKFITGVDNELKRLVELKKLSVDDLRNSELFFTVLTQAAQIAVRNHQQEKLDALRNIVVNAAITPEYDQDDSILLFLRLTDNLTELHIRLLKLFDQDHWIDQVDMAEELGATGNLPSLNPISRAIEKYFKTPTSAEGLVSYCILDLVAMNLVEGETSYKIQGTDLSFAIKTLAKSSLTTSMGKKYLAFLRSS